MKTTVVYLTFAIGITMSGIILYYAFCWISLTRTRTYSD